MKSPGVRLSAWKTEIVVWSHPYCRTYPYAGTNIQSSFLWSTNTLLMTSWSGRPSRWLDLWTAYPAVVHTGKSFTTRYSFTLEVQYNLCFMATFLTAIFLLRPKYFLAWLVSVLFYWVFYLLMARELWKKLGSTKDTLIVSVPSARLGIRALNFHSHCYR